MLSRLLVLIALLVTAGAGVAGAQGDDLPTPSPTPPPTAPPTEPSFFPLTIRTPAQDGHTLVGELFLLGPAYPSVLLLHELYADHTGWGDLPGSLLAAGYNVLAVDLRGHGATGGAINWPQAVVDVADWLTWMRSVGLRGDAISLIGSSMGASLALVGCANDPLCPTAIALSPGWAYYGISVEAAFAENFGARPVLLVYAVDDYYPALGVPQMVEAGSQNVVVEEYAGNAHGFLLLESEGETLIPALIAWLARYGG